MERRATFGFSQGFMIIGAVVAAVTGYALFLTGRHAGGLWLNALFLIAIFGVMVAICRLMARGALGSLEQHYQRHPTRRDAPPENRRRRREED